MAGRYRTIVADPPWEMKAGPQRTRQGSGRKYPAPGHGPSRPLPYSTMTVNEIAALPVRELSERDAHLYLWTTSHHIEDACGIVREWGFRRGPILTWCKAPRGLGLGGAFTSTTEFVVTGRRGSLKNLSRVDTSWFCWPRLNSNWKRHMTNHSVKPEAFLDLVEQVSPGPHLELFARRNRLGWDTWGNEALNHVELGAEKTDRSEAA